MASAPENFTPAEMLAEVKKAIYTVLVGGQSYSIGSRSMTRADLSLLKSMRDDLEAQVATGANTGLMDNTFVVVFEGR
ncbi:MAG: peptidylprolyl isomerase [Firmicutes bacterium HGW-Firmicutes-16]|nr:MAG: peptidylprolyl isomerase [Firmicutes bacterium HGW-Firmicutes-16]